MNFLTQLKAAFTENDPPYWSLRQYAETHADEARGEGHLLFAAYAAFPMLLTPDLLYKIWLNFRQYPGEGQTEIPRVVVSDVLVSDLVSEVGPEVFEIDDRARDFLIGYLEERDEGEERLRQLAEFMFYYSTNTIFSKPGFPESILEILRWNALAFFNPSEAISELKEQLRVAYARKNDYESARLNQALERIDGRLATLQSNKYQSTAKAFRALLSYTRGVRAFFRGDMAEAVANLEQIPAYRIGARNTAPENALPVPRAAREALGKKQKKASAKKEEGKLRALLIGIDRYASGKISQLTGAVNDTRALAGYLSHANREENLDLRLLLDEEATRANFQNRIIGLLQRAKKEDTVLIYFCGHGLNQRRGSARHAKVQSRTSRAARPEQEQDSPRNALLFYDHKPEQAALLYEDEFRQLVERFDRDHPHIVLILDTHAGSDGWLDTDSDRHVILSACRDEEQAQEIAGAGVFSAALLAALEEEGTPPLSYRQVMQKILREVAGRFDQTPQLFCTPGNLDRFFLGREGGATLRLQQLFASLGGYDGPLDGRPNDALGKAMDDFRKEYELEQEDDLLDLVERRALLGDATSLRLLVLMGEGDHADQILAELERLNISFEKEVDIYGPSPESIVDPDRLYRAHSVLIVLDERLLADESARRMIKAVDANLRLGAQMSYALYLQNSSEDTETLYRGPAFPQPLGMEEGKIREQDLHRAMKEVERAMEEFGRFLPKKSNAGVAADLSPLIEKARITGRLNLRNIGLTSVPEAVLELTGLEKLDLSRNQITELPPGIGRLKQLKKLDLFQNQIEDLTPLAPLTQLEQLNLSTNRIEDLTPLSGMTRLRGLDLDHNQVRDISPLFNIETPEWIDLRHNRLTELPPEVVRWGLELKWDNDYRGGLILGGNPLEGDWSVKIQRDPEGAWEELLNFEPNEWLMEHLPKILAPYSEEISELFEREKAGKKVSLNRWRMGTLNFLPVPIVEHLRRLMVPLSGEDGFSEFGQARLEQFHILFQYFMHYINSIFLALLNSEPQFFNAGIPERLRIEIKNYRDVSKSVPGYDFASFSSAFQDIFQQKASPQQPETELIDSLLRVVNGKEVDQVLRFFQSLAPSTPPENSGQSATSCRQAEIQITTLFEQLSFLFQYRLASVKNVNIVRVKPELSYRATMIDMHDLLGGLVEINYTTDLPLEPQSVILYQPRNEQIPRSYYLNLSPFWIDEVSFQRRSTDISKVLVFDHWDDTKECYTFRSIFNPKEFVEIRAQERDFSQLFRSLQSFFDKFELPDSPAEKALSSTFTDPRDQQTYPTVTWKGRRWLGANLNYDVGEGSWHYEDDPDNAERYGRFYNWEAAGAACPPGWRLPTIEEWKELAAEFGGYVDLTNGEEEGDPQAGFFALEGGESFGFNFRLAGWLDTFKTYRQRGRQGGYWSDTLKDEDEVYSVIFNGEDNQLQLSSNFRNRVHMSVRCVEEEVLEKRGPEEQPMQGAETAGADGGEEASLSKNQLIEEWYRLHYKEMLQYAKALARGRTEEAEDVVQDLFLELSELSREELEEIEQPRDYFRYWIKKSLERTTKRKTVSIEESILDFIDPGDDLAGKLKREEDFKALYKVIQNLDEKAREIINLQLKGATIEEITKMAELKNESVTRTLLYRIRKSLQSRLSNL